MKKNSKYFRFIFYICTCLTLLFGCSNGQEIDESVEMAVEQIASAIQEKNENYSVTYTTLENTLQGYHSDINFVIKSLDPEDTYDSYYTYYSEDDCDALYHTYEEIFESIKDELYFGVKYKGDINLEVDSYDDKPLVSYKYTIPQPGLYTYYFNTYLKDDIKDAYAKSEEDVQAPLVVLEEPEVTEPDIVEPQPTFDNTIPTIISDYLNQSIIESKGGFQYEMVNGSLVLYSDWGCPNSLALYFIFDGNKQYMDSYISSLATILDGDVFQFRLVGFNNKIIYEVRTLTGVAYRVEYPEYGFAGEVLINEF